MDGKSASGMEGQVQGRCAAGGRCRKAAQPVELLIISVGYRRHDDVIPASISPSLSFSMGLITEWASLKGEEGKRGGGRENQ